MWEKQILCALLREIFSRPCLLFVWIFSTASFSYEKEYMILPIFKIAIRDKFTRIKLTHILIVQTTNLILKLLGARVNICVTKKWWWGKSLVKCTEALTFTPIFIESSDASTVVNERAVIVEEGWGSIWQSPVIKMVQPTVVLGPIRRTKVEIGSTQKLILYLTGSLTGGRAVGLKYIVRYQH